MNLIFYFISMFTISSEDICSKFDRLCSQVCENTDDSYVCKCHPGFQLLEDKITCVAIKNSTESNEVLPNATEYVTFISQ